MGHTTTGSIDALAANVIAHTPFCKQANHLATLFIVQTESECPSNDGNKPSLRRKTLRTQLELIPVSQGNVFCPNYLSNNNIVHHVNCGQERCPRL